MTPRLTTAGERAVRLVASLALTTSLALCPFTAGPAAAESDRAGNAIIVDPRDWSHGITRGDSNTVWTLRLPQGASCPGDTFNDDWRIQTFIVPATDDPGTMKYRAIGPAGTTTDDKWALYGADTVPFVQQATAKNDTPGHPGLIIMPLPDFSFGVFRPGYLPPGHYRMGVACALAWVTGRYWDTEIDLTQAPDVQPGQFRWTVVGSSASARSSNGGFLGGAPRWVLFTAFAAGLVMLVVLLTRRTDGRTPRLPKERS
jgi:hypothetical protein